jgi:hypothetical protein
MREGAANTAAIEVHNLWVLVAGEDDLPVESVAAPAVDETGALRRFQGVALIGEMAPQISARGIADSEFVDQGGIAHAALFEIAGRFRAIPQLPLVESGSLLHHVGGLSRKGLLSFDVSDALAEGEVLGQFDKANQISALAAAVAVEQILAGVDIKRRASFRVEGT